MAYSEDTDFSMTGGAIIKKALQKIAVLEEGEEPNTTQYMDGLVDLNMLIKALSRYGLNIWSIIPVYYDLLIEGQASYRIGPDANWNVDDKPIEIISIAIQSTNLSATTGDKQTLTRMSFIDYDELPNPATKGFPTQYCFQPSFPSSDIYLWPTPDADTAANYRMSVWAQKYIQNINAISDDMFFPAEWLEPMVYQLAIRIAPDYGIPLQERKMLEIKADQYLKETLDWDTEHTSIYIRPEIRWQK